MVVGCSCWEEWGYTLAGRPGVAVLVEEESRCDGRCGSVVFARLMACVVGFEGLRALGVINVLG